MMDIDSAGTCEYDASTMQVRFADPKLDQLETDGQYDGGFSAQVVRMYRMRMQQIRAATDERTFYELKSLHFEKLEGKRGDDGDRSMRLNDQWRLILRLEGESPNKIAVIQSVEDYH